MSLHLIFVRLFTRKANSYLVSICEKVRSALGIGYWLVLGRDPSRKEQVSTALGMAQFWNFFGARTSFVFKDTPPFQTQKSRICSGNFSGAFRICSGYLESCAWGKWFLLRKCLIVFGAASKRGSGEKRNPHHLSRFLVILLMLVDV